jgi:pimeloyl-ACP methyl ester carboxylesterase
MPSDVAAGLSVFHRFATRVSAFVSRAWFFVACVLLVLLWARSVFLLPSPRHLAADHQHGHHHRHVPAGSAAAKHPIDGVDIHFVHLRSRDPGALPLIMTHGWPGSVVELLGTIGPLTDPTSSGGRAEDAFDLVLPSLPGYGFSGEPAELGWDVGRIARAWAELMRRLGYSRYVA